MKRVTVGLVGAGFIAELHMHGYRRVYGVEVVVSTVCSRGEGAAAFAARHGIAQVERDWRALLADPAIDVIDLCTPPNLHAEMVVACMQAGKHVICEKPFTGYFGRPGDATPIGLRVPKREMYARVMERWAGCATPSAPVAGCSCMPRIGCMRPPSARRRRSSARPATRSCS